MKLIEEVKSITAKAVAEKQEKAKANISVVIDRIKEEAAKGKSSLYVPLTMMDEYGRDLLTQQGFNCFLEDERLANRHNDIYNALEVGAGQAQKDKKVWAIFW